MFRPLIVRSMAPLLLIWWELYCRSHQNIHVCYVIDGTDFTIQVEIRFMTQNNNFRPRNTTKQASSEEWKYGTTNNIHHCLQHCAIASCDPPWMWRDNRIHSYDVHCIPGVIVLRTRVYFWRLPVKKSEFTDQWKRYKRHWLITDTWTFRTDSFLGWSSHFASLHRDTSHICPTTTGTTSSSSSSSSNLMIPFPLSCTMNRLRFIKENDTKTERTIEGLEILLMKPKRGTVMSLIIIVVVLIIVRGVAYVP